MFTTYTAAPYGWYIEMYIGLFLLSPFFNAAWHALDERAQKALMFSLIGLTALPMYLVSYIPDRLIYPVLAQAVPAGHHRLFWMSLVVLPAVVCSAVLAQPIDWAVGALMKLVPAKTKNAQES